MIHSIPLLEKIRGVPGTGHSRFRFALIVIVVCFALLLTGCTPSITDKEVLDIFAAIISLTVLGKARAKALTEFDHFVKHRVRALINENSSWKTAPYDTLANRIATEIDAVATFVDKKIGLPDTPGKLGGAIDPDTPSHTDLTDVAKIFVDDGEGDVAKRQADFINNRRQRVRRIIWRALAVHANLWTNPQSPTDVGIQEVALEEVLNRRLRFVERMLHTDSAQANRELKWSITAAGGPWTDSTRTVQFEYPFIGVGGNSNPFLSALTAAGLNLSDLSANFTESGPPQDLIRYKVRAGRIRPEAANHWKPLASDPYIWEMNLNGKTPAQIFDLLAPATSPVNPVFENFWERNWIFCDHMVSVLEVDSLRFGLFRRTQSENEFNSAASSGVRLSMPIPAVGKPDPNSLLNNGSDYFEGVAIGVEDLQIGDLVIIWNNYFFRSLFSTDFGLENSIISNISGDDPRGSSLVGHGAPEENYSGFVGGLVGTLDGLLKGLREKITKTIDQGDPTHDYLTTGSVIKIKSPFTGELVFWNPFDEDLQPADTSQQLKVPGAWWIRIRLSAVKLDLNQALILFPKSVAIDTNLHTPPKFLENHDADYKESIYVPLSMPKGVRGGWAAYFKQAKDDIDDGLPPPMSWKLEDAKTDADWAPGFHYAGPGTKIPVLRPKVRI